MFLSRTACCTTCFVRGLRAHQNPRVRRLPAGPRPTNHSMRWRVATNMCGADKPQATTALRSSRAASRIVSHVWGLGQDRMRVVKDRLTVLLPELIVFLDVDDLREGGGAHDVMRAARVCG